MAKVHIAPTCGCRFGPCFLCFLDDSSLPHISCAELGYLLSKYCPSNMLVSTRPKIFSFALLRTKLLSGFPVAGGDRSVRVASTLCEQSASQLHATKDRMVKVTCICNPASFKSNDSFCG